MNHVKQKLDELSQKCRQITLYRNPDVKAIMKGIGRVPGKFDSQLLDFLQFTNGASIFDYCFMGLKNPKLGVDIDKFVAELWPANTMLANQFVGFMATSANSVFGYLINIGDPNGIHPIAYSSNDDPERIHVIASSFRNFMEIFLRDVENTINSHPNGPLFQIDEPGWPIKIEHWISMDEQLRLMYNDGTLDNFFKKNMPLASWY